MTDRTLSRTQTNVAVRQVLVRHWIDLSSLQILPQRDRVRVTGTIQVKREMPSPQGMASLLAILENEIRACHGVRQVIFDLDNWLKDIEGGWHERQA